MTSARTDSAGEGLAVEVRAVRKIYKPGQRGEIVALQGLDLEVRRGDVFGFIGPNGAGKTTTIKILTGLSWPSSGVARIFGRVAGSVEARLRLGYLPEVASYHEFMAVAELLRLHALLAGLPSAQIRAACDEALSAVRLTDRAGSRIRELSKGMQQRFGIAQALVARPDLLILDEPTSGLDPLSQKEVKDIILELKSRGITIFFSSHKLTEVEHICDVIGILHRGRLLRCCPLDDLLTAGDTVAIRFTAAAAALEPLRAAGWAIAGRPEAAVLRTDRPRADAAVDALRGHGASIVSLEPARLTLEDAFFQQISVSETAAALP